MASRKWQVASDELSVRNHRWQVISDGKSQVVECQTGERNATNDGVGMKSIERCDFIYNSPFNVHHSQFIRGPVAQSVRALC